MKHGQIEITTLVNLPSTSLPEYLGVYKEEETEAQKTARREKELSTSIIGVDLFKSSVTVTVPLIVEEEIERNAKRIEYIKEVREKAKRYPIYDNKFPEGNTPVRDVQRLIDDIEHITSMYVNEPITESTIQSLHWQLNGIFDRFVNDCDSYIMYI